MQPAGHAGLLAAAMQRVIQRCSASRWHFTERRSQRQISPHLSRSLQMSCHPVGTLAALLQRSAGASAASPGAKEWGVAPRVQGRGAA
jgi:hypothetical protein